ncbi:hypothetical protein RYX53_03275 [Alkalibacillus haloalkaliphilus]|nr:hypothetical protein [Alkalibacillus haloalkaliphilus]
MYTYIYNNILDYGGECHVDYGDGRDGVCRGVFCDGVVHGRDDRVDDPSPYPFPPFIPFTIFYKISISWLILNV